MAPNIPPGSWGGDFDPKPQFYCPKCGAQTPFQGLCEQHAREAEAQLRARHAEQLQAAQAQPQPAPMPQPAPQPAQPFTPGVAPGLQAPQRMSANITQQLVADSLQRLQRLRTSVERGGLDRASMMHLLEVMTELQFALVERLK